MSTPFEHKPGTGSISSKGDKTTANSPDYKGELVLDRDYRAGEKIKLGGWVKQYQWGSRIGLKINTWKPDADYKPREVRGKDEIDSEIPF